MHRLEIALLGGFSVVRDGRAVTAFESDQVRALLAYLAAAPARPHPRATLADLLWPGHADAAARANLRHALSRLRHALGDTDPARPLVLTDNHTIRLALDDDIVVDVAAFEVDVAASAAHDHAAPERCPECEVRLETAAARYHGALLADLTLSRSPVFQEWLRERRATLERQAVEILGLLARIAERAGDHARARQLAERQLAIDPWREEAQAQLIRALASLSERGAALAQYRRYREGLAVEFGGEPSEQLAALAAQIRDAVPSPHLHLPAPPTPFVGRQEELARLAARLHPGGPRLLTLIGPGGVGKTRLALAAAALAADAFPDGVWFVDCAPLRDPARIPGQIVAALNLAELPSHNPLAALATQIERRRMLLLLDNLEQLPGAGGLLGALLRMAPNLALLATSRIPVRVTDEELIHVPPLRLPERHASPQLNDFTQYDALNLFVLRAQAYRPGFVVDATCRETVAEICQRLDGLPLALDLAAARLRLLSPSTLLAQLTQPLELLDGSNSTPRRQQTLRATISWSYDLLGEPARALFRQLSVFVDGWTAEAAAAVCRRLGGRGDLLEALDTLLDSSLVQPALSAGSRVALEPRFQMLVVIREYAAERLGAHGERAALHEAHARHFFDLAERAARELRGQQQLFWLETIEADYANLQAAFRWLLKGGQASLALRLAVNLWYYWVRRERPNDGCAWLEEALQIADDIDRPTYAQGLACLAYLLFRCGELAHAQAIAYDARAHFEALGDEAGAPFATLVLAHVACHRSEGLGAVRLYEQSLAGFRRVGDSFWVAWVLLDLAHIYRGIDLERTESLLQESEAIFRRHGMTYARSAVLTARGQAHAARGHLSQAERLLEEGRELCRRQGENDAWQLLLLGEVAGARGNLGRAQALFAESLASYEGTGVHKGIALATVGLGWVTLAAGDVARAASLLERGRELFYDLGDRWGVAFCYCGLGWLALAECDLRWARHTLGRSLSIYLEVDRKKGLAECLHGLAAVAFLDQTDALLAARLLGAAEAAQDKAEIPLTPLVPALQTSLHDVLRRAGEALDLSAAMDEGRRWPLDRILHVMLPP